MLTAIALVLAAENCAPRGDVIGMLSESFGEVGHGGGLTRQTAVEIWANDESGTWTIITTRPDGMSCIVASGSDWGPIPAMEGAPA